MLVHEAHGSNVLLDRTFVWGEVEKDFAASPAPSVAAGKMGHASSTVPIETFGVVASWDPWRDILDVYASIQMPKYPDQIAMALRIPASPCACTTTSTSAAATASSAASSNRCWSAIWRAGLAFPVRLIEDRLENMRGGDAHGPERLFDVDVAFDDSGIVRSMKMRALENVGAYAGRSPFQLGKPIGAIVGPVQNQERAVSRDRRQSPTRRAGCGAWLRPGADQSGARAR